MMLPRMFDYVDKWASECPNDVALIEYNTQDTVTWAQFRQATVAFAAKLLSIGLQKGDIICTSLPCLKEHVYLMYAAMRIGVIVAPLDLRLKEHEIARCFDLVKPRAYFFLGKTPIVDFRPMIGNLMKRYHADKIEDDTAAPGASGAAATGQSGLHYIDHWVQFQKEEDLIISGAVGITQFAANIKRLYIVNMIKELFGYGVYGVSQSIGKRDCNLIIFTTGSTGHPKAAMLCHENVLIQNIGLKVAFMPSAKDLRMLVNLPPSHVGCVTEQLATTIFVGGVSVLLHVFDAQKSLDAIQKHKVNALGQIPALFAMQWRLPDYSDYDLSSLEFCLYGGQAVTRQFLEQLQTMAPGCGSGLGLTEAAGFVTYTPLDGTVDDILASIGFDSPLCPISIREPMNADGTAGRELPRGEIGEICFEGEQVFLGYYADEENTRQTVSRDGILYTGDVGSYDDAGLHFSSRRKFIIKPKGYQVFPPEVEDYIENQFKDQIGKIGVVGVHHDVFSEGIVAVIELNEGHQLTADQVLEKSKDMAAYKRPSAVVFVEKGTFPLNRVAKTDYIELKTIAEKHVQQLKEQGKWD